MGIEGIGEFHIAVDNQEERLNPLKINGLDEILFLSTCNRVELWFRTNHELTGGYLKEILGYLYPLFDEQRLNFAFEKALVYSHEEAVDHVFKVAASLNSLVIGEREILTQVREAHSNCQKWGYSQDFMRILIRKTIEVAKRVYTETQISTRPISVVNLAYFKLVEELSDLNTRFIFIGAGKTNKAMARKLHKAGFKDFTVFNRTLKNAETFVEAYGGSAYALTELATYSKGFDVIVSCTGAEENMVTPELFDQLNKGQNHKVSLVDLAIPFDVAEEIQNKEQVRYISISQLKEVAAANLEARKGDLEKCEGIVSEGLKEFEDIVKVRQVELAMRKVPQQVKEIRKRATEVVFAEEIAHLDDSAKETLEKVIAFMEKKYMSTPMLLAKEILLKNEAS